MFVVPIRVHNIMKQRNLVFIFRKPTLLIGLSNTNKFIVLHVRWRGTSATVTIAMYDFVRCTQKNNLVVRYNLK